MNLETLLKDYIVDGGLTRAQAIAELDRQLRNFADGEPARARPRPQARPPAPPPARGNGSFRSEAWYAEKAQAAREYDRQRAAVKRQAQIEGLDPLLQAADVEIARRNVMQNYETIKELQAAGRPIPYALIESVKRTADFVERGIETPGRRQYR